VIKKESISLGLFSSPYKNPPPEGPGNYPWPGPIRPVSKEKPPLSLYHLRD
jgi:hypothetical protein